MLKRDYELESKLKSQYNTAPSCSIATLSAQIRVTFLTRNAFQKIANAEEMEIH